MPLKEYPEEIFGRFTSGIVEGNKKNPKAIFDQLMKQLRKLSNVR